MDTKKRGWKFLLISVVFLVLEFILVTVVMSINGSSYSTLMDIPTFLEVLCIPCVYYVIGKFIIRKKEEDFVYKYLYKISLLSGVCIGAVYAVLAVQAMTISVIDQVQLRTSLCFFALLYGAMLSIAFLAGDKITD